jgi:hypothetical protein
MKYFLVIISLIITSQIHTQNFRITHIQSGKAIEGNGIFYYLPKTVFQVEITLLKTEKKRGPYSLYAEKYFGKEQFIKVDANEYKLVRVDIKPIMEPDPNQLYLITQDSKSAISISTGPTGILRGINTFTEFPEPVRQIFLQDNKTLAVTDRSYSPILKWTYKTDTIINREYTRDSTIIERRNIVRTVVENNPEEGAKSAFQKIQDIRNRKYELISGPEDVSFDGEAVRYMVSELDRMENDYLRMFLGTTESGEKKISFRYEPVAGIDRNLFNFTREKGVYFNKSITGIESASISITPTTDQKLLQESTYRLKDLSQKEKYQKFFYRIPVAVNIQIKLDDEILLNKDMVLPQLGTLNFIGLSNPGSTRIYMDEFSGNIQRIEYLGK